MSAVQLEFNLNNESETEVRLSTMQRQIDAIDTTSDKVRRKLFAELTELKKIVSSLKEENEQLKNTLQEIKNEKENCKIDV